MRHTNQHLTDEVTAAPQSVSRCRARATRLRAVPGERCALTHRRPPSLGATHRARATSSAGITRRHPPTRTCAQPATECRNHAKAALPRRLARQFLSRERSGGRWKPRRSPSRERATDWLTKTASRPFRDGRQGGAGVIASRTTAGVLHGPAPWPAAGVPGDLLLVVARTELPAHRLGGRRFHIGAKGTHATTPTDATHPALPGGVPSHARRRYASAGPSRGQIATPWRRQPALGLHPSRFDYAQAGIPPFREVGGHEAHPGLEASRRDPRSDQPSCARSRRKRPPLRVLGGDPTRFHRQSRRPNLCWPVHPQRCPG